MEKFSQDLFPGCVKNLSETANEKPPKIMVFEGLNFNASKIVVFGYPMIYYPSALKVLI
jgi:hypothetical protein